MCDPYLNAFRGILPPVFGIDFSPFLAFAVLQVAAAGSTGAHMAPRRRLMDGPDNGCLPTVRSQRLLADCTVTTVISQLYGHNGYWPTVRLQRLLADCAVTTVVSRRHGY